MTASRCRNCNRHNIRILAAFFQRVANNNVLELRAVFLDISNTTVNGGSATSLNLQGVQSRTQCCKCFNCNVIDEARANNTQNLCIFLRQQLYTNTRNRCGTIRTDEVCGEKCLRCTRFLVVQNDHQNGTRQTFFPVFYIRTIPLHASHIELSAQICRHCHEPSVRSILRHVRKFRIVWKADHAAVRISILAAHPVIAIIQQLYNLFHTVGTRNDVVYASCQHILFT